MFEAPPIGILVRKYRREDQGIDNSLPQYLNIPSQKKRQYRGGPVAFVQFKNQDKQLLLFADHHTSKDRTPHSTQKLLQSVIEGFHNNKKDFLVLVENNETHNIWGKIGKEMVQEAPIHSLPQMIRFIQCLTEELVDKDPSITFHCVEHRAPILFSDRLFHNLINSFCPVIADTTQENILTLLRNSRISLYSEITRVKELIDTHVKYFSTRYTSLENPFLQIKQKLEERQDMFCKYLGEDCDIALNTPLCDLVNNLDLVTKIKSWEMDYDADLHHHSVDSEILFDLLFSESKRIILFVGCVHWKDMVKYLENINEWELVSCCLPPQQEELDKDDCPLLAPEQVCNLISNF